MPAQTVLPTPAPTTTQQQPSSTSPGEWLPPDLIQLVTPLCAALAYALLIQLHVLVDSICPANRGVSGAAALLPFLCLWLGDDLVEKECLVIRPTISKRASK